MEITQVKQEENKYTLKNDVEQTSKVALYVVATLSLLIGVWGAACLAGAFYSHGIFTTLTSFITTLL